MLGNGRLEAYCYDGETRLCHIRGKMRKQVWVAVVRARDDSPSPCIPSVVVVVVVVVAGVAGVWKRPSHASLSHPYVRVICVPTRRWWCWCLVVLFVLVLVLVLVLVYLLACFTQGDIVLVSLRDFQDAKGDVIMKYTAEEARELKKKKWLPENGECVLGFSSFTPAALCLRLLALLSLDCAPGRLLGDVQLRSTTRRLRVAPAWTATGRLASSSPTSTTWTWMTSNATADNRRRL
jgi:translation initiation factor IF-1